MNDKKIIPIFFTVDDAYVPYLSVAITSLLQNASHDYAYRIIVLHEDIPQTRRDIVKELATVGSEITFFSMKDKIQGITDRLSNRLRCDYFTMTIYFRLFIPMLFPEYDKGIYIDSDIVAPGDISKLYEIELGNCLLGACPDFSIRNVPELVNYTNLGVGVGIENYFNSGVLLMNLLELRNAMLEKRFLELLNRWHFDTIAPDQDYLNVMCYGRIVYLEECWDAMPKDGELPLKAPKLIHYNLFSKPWCYDGIPYEDYFWKYAKQTPFIEEIREYKKTYSKQQKRSDSEALSRLVSRAAEISRMKQNFRTVFASGKEERLR